MRSAPVGARCGIAINGRAAVRRQIGGVERYAREMAARLPALHPGRYRVIRPPEALAHRAGHAWEQLALPLQAARVQVLYSPANLAPVLGGRNAVVIHDVAPLRCPQAYSAAYVAYQRRMLPAIARRARLVLTVSEFSRAELIEALDVDPSRIRVAPPGVDERFRTDADADGARARLGLTQPYVLALGTASARKNVAVLEPVARELVRDGVELVLGGSERGYLRGGAAAVRRLGYVAEEDLPGLFAGAGAFVMPSLHEGFGLPCMEAMACGTPVVAADAGALPETCAGAAALVAPEDPAAIAGALRTVLVDGALRRRRVQAGLRRAAEFSWSRTAALTDAALSELLH